MCVASFAADARSAYALSPGVARRAGSLLTRSSSLVLRYADKLSFKVTPLEPKSRRASGSSSAAAEDGDTEMTPAKGSAGSAGGGKPKQQEQKVNTPQRLVDSEHAHNSTAETGAIAHNTRAPNPRKRSLEPEVCAG